MNIFVECFISCWIIFKLELDDAYGEWTVLEDSWTQEYLAYPAGHLILSKNILSKTQTPKWYSWFFCGFNQVTPVLLWFFWGPQHSGQVHIAWVSNVSYDGQLSFRGQEKVLRQTEMNKGLGVGMGDTVMSVQDNVIVLVYNLAD